MAIQVEAHVGKESVSVEGAITAITSSQQTSPPSPETYNDKLPLLLRIILTDADDKNTNNIRDLSLTKAVATLSTPDLLTQLSLLDEFRRSTDNNLYQRVRALFFLYAVHRFHLPERRRLIEKKRKSNHANNGEKCVEDRVKSDGNVFEKDETFICPKGYKALLDRRFDEAIDHFLQWVSSSSSTLSLSPDEEEDITVNDHENEKGNVIYPLPKTTSLISKLSFSRDGPSPITHTTAAEDYRENDTATLSRGHSSSNASSSLLSLSSHVSEEATSVKEPNSISTSTQKHSTDTLTQQTLLLPSEATSSALAKSYRSLAFQTLADQVKRSVRSHEGNEWMFNVNNVNDTPLVWSEELYGEKGGQMLIERTPVRMDLSHVSFLLKILVCQYSILFVYL